MRLSLKTKFTLATSLLVLAVVAVVSALYLGRLTSQVLHQADDRARLSPSRSFCPARTPWLMRRRQAALRVPSSPKTFASTFAPPSTTAAR